jgi:exodeoxyribonuclease V beta subunit
VGERPPAADVAAARVAFATEVRAEVRRRKDAGRLFTYDDMLTRLRDALAHPVHGPSAVRRLRQRFRIVLVDEFQDTDPVQWDILRRAFHGFATLVLIGDPKQAIYAFRGADVFSYLDAVDQADHRATLSTNWRSDQDLVGAVTDLLGGAALGDERIVVRPVSAQHADRRLSVPAQGDPGLGSPIRVRVLPNEAEADRLPPVGRLRPRVAADLAADVTTVLSSGLLLDLGDGPRPVGPGDIAVLVRRNQRADEIRDALIATGVPAVVLGATSVYSSDLATHWLTLLTALEQPRAVRVRQAALTPFVGWTFSRLAAAGEEAQTELSQQLRWWSRVVRARGVAALLETISTDTRLSERLLALVGGERMLTDLRHIGQSLHAAMVGGQLGVGALVEWLRERVLEAQTSTPTAGLRRLETDAAAVQILTLHRAKGLQFPIVYLPEAWDRYVSTKDAGHTLRLHTDGERVLDVGGLTGPGRGDRLAGWQQEEDAEDLRLCYVGATRAQCQLVTWWAPSATTPASALQRFLYGPRRPGAEPAARYEVAGDPLSLPPVSPGVAFERVTERPVRPWQPPAAADVALRARVFDRELDLEWRRTSYTGLTAAVHGMDLSPAGVGSEPEPAKEDDESVPEDVAPPPGLPSADPRLARRSPMHDLPSGPQFGTVVHDILESVGAGDDLATEVQRVTAEELSRTPPGDMTVEALAEGLLPALQTPLGPLAEDLRLCDFAAGDRLAELTFELPLAGGGASSAQVSLGQLAPLLRHHLGSDDPLSRYPDLLAHPALADQSLRGYLTGSIDAVLRVRSGAAPRYLVVDYKTNWLGDFDGGELTLGHYAPRRLAEAMMQAHYPLQALLYSVAVHRMLRWRQAGYDPAHHLGGILYLFVRGMAGPDTPVVDGSPCGVFAWHPPAALVTDLSDLLEGS